MSKIQDALRRANEDRVLRNLERHAPGDAAPTPWSEAAWQEVRRWETAVVRRSGTGLAGADPADKAEGACAEAAAPPGPNGYRDWEQALREAQTALASCQQQVARERSTATAAAADVTAQEAVIARATQELALRQDAARRALARLEAAERLAETQRRRVAALQEGQELAVACRRAEQEVQATAQMAARASRELAQYQARHRELTTTLEDLHRRLSEALARIEAPGTGGSDQGPAGHHPEAGRA